MMSYFKFKAWEMILLLLSLLFFASSIVVYLSDLSLRKYFLGWEDEQGKELVGKLGEKSGIVRRQLNQDMEFRTIEKTMSLYNYDTIVTHNSGAATLALEDGGSIQLGPNTMVRLSFESKFSLQGISRAARIEVVSGSVKGQAKGMAIELKSRDKVVSISKDEKSQIEVPEAPLVKPKPELALVVPPIVPVAQPPSKVEIRFLSPKEGELIALEKDSKALEKTIEFQWEVTPTTQDKQLLVIKNDKDEEVYNKEVRSDSQGKGSEGVPIRAPGNYRWELKKPDGSLLQDPSISSRFTLSPEFEGIEVLSPLVGGAQTKSNKYLGAGKKNFDITLLWKAYPKVKTYTVKIMNAPVDGKVLMEKSVHKTEYLFNKGKIFSGKIYYKIFALLPSGFMATSTPTEFNFDFLPPLLVQPQMSAKIVKKDLKGDNGKVLLTWQKTSFTEAYELEIGSDSEFKNPLFKNKVKENFYVFRPTSGGKYYWRVKSYSESTESVFSQANQFELTVTP